MKIKKIGLGLFLVFILVSCASKPTESTSTEEKAPVVEKPVVEEKKVEQKKRKEPQDPPNVAFAKKLQAYLDKNQIKEAIALFDKLPKELENDLDFKIILGSLYLSDKQYDNVIAISNEVLQIDPNNLEA